MDITSFVELRATITGQLAPECYFQLYQLARDAQPGYILDIGPAQGATSVSIALGIKESGNDSQLFSIDRFYGSRAMQHMKKDRMQDNIDVLQSNFEKYGVEHLTNIIPGRLDKVINQIPEDRPISMISIDADGCLDRDFELLYDRLVPGAPVFIDDYSDAINSQGNMLVQSSELEIEKYQNSSIKSGKWNETETIKNFTPLGKPYSIYKFTNFMVDAGCLVETDLIGNAWFGKISDSKPELDRVGLNQVREDIYQEYLSVRASA